jgi:hypothetical protein
MEERSSDTLHRSCAHEKYGRRNLESRVSFFIFFGLLRLICESGAFITLLTLLRFIGVTMSTLSSVTVVENIVIGMGIIQGGMTAIL